MKEINVDDAERMAVLTDEINEKCQELWSIAMRNLLLNGKEYKSICKMGKFSNVVYGNLYEKFYKFIPEKKLDRLMPRYYPGCCFN